MSSDQLLENHASRIEGEGFIENVKKTSRKLAFLHVKTAEGLVQLVKYDKEGVNIKDFNPGSYIYFSGEQKDNANIIDERFGGKEIQVSEISIGTKAEVLPVLEGGNEMNIAANFRHLQLRTDEYQKQFEIANDVEYGIVKYFHENGFIKSRSPKIIGTASEGGAEVFEIGFYDEKAFLAQSPQFSKQMMIASGFESTYDISKAFRADPSSTSRHLSEFVSVDAETVIKKGGNHHDIMDMQEELLKSLITQIAEKYGEDLGISSEIPEIPRIPLSEVKEILEREYNHTIAEGTDIDPEGEKLISEYAKKEYNSDFIYLINYPTEFRPFYHMVDESTGLTNSFDLLYRGVEISTGSQREHRIDTLLDQAQSFKKKVDPDTVKEYIDLFRHGIPAHGGFGLGLERLIQKIVGKSNVKLVPLKAVSKGNVPF